MPYLQYLDNSQRKYYKLPETKMAIFGREDHTDFQIINDGLVSREHFGIEKDDQGRWVIIDLGSRNGTYINDHHFVNEIIPIKNDDIVKAGKQEFVFLDELPTKTDEDIFREVEKVAISGKDYKSLMHEIVDTIKIKKM